VFNLGGPEILVILLLALIVLGPDKLPDAARSVGRFTAEVRRMSNGFRSEVKAAFDAETARSDAQASQASQAAQAAQASLASGPDDDIIEAQARARGEELAARSTDPDEPPAPADEP
jgi:sec-independent protein translocase protein TatB